MTKRLVADLKNVVSGALSDANKEGPKEMVGTINIAANNGGGPLIGMR